MQVMELIEETRLTIENLVNVKNELEAEYEDIMFMGEADLPETLRPLANMRASLNEALISAIQRSINDLLAHKEELTVVQCILDTTDRFTTTIRSAIEDAVEDCSMSLDDADTLLAAHVKYNLGTEGLKRRTSEFEIVPDRIVILNDIAEFAVIGYDPPMASSELCPCGINRSACSYHKD
jgi:hypothetical protein